MNKLSPQSGISQESFSTQVNQSGTQELRKSLIFQLNPKIQQIFGNIDFDYSEIFIGFAVFPSLQKEVQSSSQEKEKKKNFFVKNYERILIHFFQFLFDYELQTLHFSQKYETIPSFGQWLENEITFQLPDRIKLLNIKKNQIKKQKEAQKNIIDLNPPQSPKRLYNEIGQNNQKFLISKIESPKKIKVTDDGSSFVDFCSKYDQVTNHTAHYTPKQNCAQREIIEQKNQIQKSLQKKQVKSKRKVLKVKQIQTSKNQSLKNIQKNNRKESYTLKPNFREKIETRRISSIEKQKAPKVPNKQKALRLPVIEQKSSKEVQKQPQIIILQSSGEQKQKKLQKKNEIQIISISQCSIIQDTPASVLEQNRQNTKEKLFQKIDQSRSNQILISLQSEQKNQIESKKIKKNEVKKVLFQKEEQDEFESFDKLRDIVQDIRISYNLQKDKSIQDFEQIYRQRQQRKLHNFRTRLSGAFRYPEKRFYIFPDMTQSYQKNQDDDTGNKKSINFKSMSKSKSLKKDFSKDKNAQ